MDGTGSSDGTGSRDETGSRDGTGFTNEAGSSDGTVSNDGTGFTNEAGSRDGTVSTDWPVTDRRTVLLGIAGVSAGCTAVLPEATPPDPEGRRNPPTLLCEGVWNGSRVTVTVAAGNRLTAGNTERLTAYGDAELTDWVGGENASQDFPLEPGDSLSLSLERGEDRVRLVWFDADGGGSSTLCTLERSSSSQGGN